MKTLATMALLMLICLSARVTGAQHQEKSDMKVVAAAGHLNGSSEYQNDYFGVRVRLPEPNSYLKLNSLTAENRAILLEAVNARGNLEQRHNFVIVAHSSYIGGHEVSAEEFVRAVCQQLEHEGLHPVRSEVPITVAGQRFIESDLKKESKEETYYKAIIVTLMKGYMFGFWMEAANKEQLEKATNLEGRISFH
jgi:hypothetical protein